MSLVLREPTADDAPELGRVVFEAFGAIPGTRLGADEVTAKIGESGMGELIGVPSIP